MFKKATTIVTLACFLFTMAKCYVNKVVPVNTLRGERLTISKVETVKGEVIEFREHTVVVNNDAIVGLTEDYKEVNIPLSEVSRVWVKKLDPALTVLAVIGVTAGVLVVLLLIALATKQSCPFVYSYDGQKYVFDGEPYGGAICEGLKRTDWCRLEYLKPVDDEYRLLLTNEVDETQYTDEFKLWVIDHDPRLEVILDGNGKPYTISDRLRPLYVFDSHGKDLMRWLSVKDEIFWDSDIRTKSPDRPSDLRDTIYFAFARPEGKKTAKLLVSGNTTLWGSQMLKRITELRGDKAHEWLDGLRNPVARNLVDAWDQREELYKLRVKIKVGNEWQTRGWILGGGPFMTEERVVPLDLTGISEDTVRLMVAPPAAFWEFDSFTMDYSVDELVTVNEIAAKKAVGHDGADLSGILSSTDGRYYVSPQPGQKATLVFNVPVQDSSEGRTVFAKVSGYYDLHLKAQGPPQTLVLNRIASEPGFPVKFALEEYAKWRTETAHLDIPGREK